MRLDLEQTRAVVDRAFDLGITLFDTADMYGGRGGSETQLGKILGHRRKDIVLASKFGMAMSDDGTKIGASRRYIMSAVEDSLRRLKTDWIDLYQLHQPDPLTPLDETMQALDDLVTQGKIRYIGCSNLPSWQVVESQWISGIWWISSPQSSPRWNSRKPSSTNCALWVSANSGDNCIWRWHPSRPMRCINLLRCPLPLPVPIR